jgi:long-subunit fatty acid transport protein
MFKRLLVPILAAGSLAVAGEHWNVDPGGVTMKFLALQVSPRSAAMAGAGIADPARASEVSRNPLAMSAMDTPEFGLSQIIFDGDGADRLVNLYFGHPVGDKFAFSAALDYLGYDDLEGRDENGLETGEYGAYSWSAQLGLGSRWSGLNWGVTARFASQTIEDETAYAILGDIAGSYRVNSYLSFGTALTNFGYVTAYDSEEEYAPMALQAGVTGRIPITARWRVHVSADAYRRADTKIYGLFGAEVAYAETLMLRLGTSVREDESDDYSPGISCGLGIVFGMVVFDYGYSPRPAFEGGNHHLAVGLRF